MSEKSADLLSEFKRIFYGGQDRFVIHVPPFAYGAGEKQHKYTAQTFVGFAKYGTASFPEIDDGFEKGDYVPCTTENYRNHLNGSCGLALSPLIPEYTTKKSKKQNCCVYAVIDIDTYNVNFTQLINRLYTDGFKFGAFQSKSGGLHIYFFFTGYEPAIDVRAVLHKIVNLYGLGKMFKDEKGASKVEVFPEHDEHKPGRKGVKDKGVFLPFYNMADPKECPNKMITAEGKLLGLEKAIPMIKEQFTSLEEMKAILNALPYADAPYCIQAALLSGELYDGSHRNDFIFTVALYLKMKHGKDAFTVDMLREANERFAEPLEDKHVENTYASAIAGDFPILGQCKKEPMASFCDKKECKERQFAAIKKDKNNVASNFEFRQMYRMKAETPYYLIEARLAGTEDEFKMLRIDAAENILNQRTIQKEGVDKLGQIMWTVKQQVWEERINEIMATMVEKEVPKETDTTELSDLRQLFNRYLTHRQVQSSSPFRITLKQVYMANETFYFQTDGLKDYLRIAKFNLQGKNLREYLLSYGCTEGMVEYDKRDGQKGQIKCWLKSNDDTLREMLTYFDEVVDQDAQVLENNKLNKKDSKDEGAEAGEDRRF